jgi:hypothetical protein
LITLVWVLCVPNSVLIRERFRRLTIVKATWSVTERLQLVVTIGVFTISMVKFRVLDLASRWVGQFELWLSRLGSLGRASKLCVKFARVYVGVTLCIRCEFSKALCGTWLLTGVILHTLHSATLRSLLAYLFQLLILNKVQEQE